MFLKEVTSGSDHGLQPQLWESSVIEFKMLKRLMKMQGLGCDNGRVEPPPFEIKKSTKGQGKSNTH